MRILPTNYVETLERWLKLPEGGRIRTEELDVAIWSLLEEVREQDESLRTIHSHNHEIIIGLQRENERLTDELREMARLHNTLEARIDAALALLTHAEDASNPWAAIKKARKLLEGTP